MSHAVFCVQKKQQPKITYKKGWKALAIWLENRKNRLKNMIIIFIINFFLNKKNFKRTLECVSSEYHEREHYWYSILFFVSHFLVKINLLQRHFADLEYQWAFRENKERKQLTIII